MSLSKLVSPQDALRQKLEAGRSEIRVSRASIDTPQDALRQSIDNLKRKTCFFQKILDVATSYCHRPASGALGSAMD
ncbi:MAG: hypothetical protein WAV28_18160 [Sedimentisphaerales bacterium]